MSKNLLGSINQFFDLFSKLQEFFGRKFSGYALLATIILTLLLLALQYSAQLEEIDPAPTDKSTDVNGANSSSVKVINIVDGDTVDVEFSDGMVARVRLAGIDTPEVHGGVECFGPEASAFAKEQLLGKEFQFIPDSKQPAKDRYGRLLGYLHKQGSQASFNELIVKNGYATLYDISTDRKPALEEAQQYAISQNLGLWGSCDLQ